MIHLMKHLARVALEAGLGDHSYIVGGAVRNHIIGQPIKDLDVVVDSVAGCMDSNEFARVIESSIPHRTYTTFNQYGVAIITVAGPWVLEGVNMEGTVIEVANARKESYGGLEGKGFKPHMVESATIEEDVLRREFTFNTLLWRLGDLVNGPDDAPVIDLTGLGLKHLQNREMWTPRDADVCFSDDPTRVLRAVKFASKYGFHIPTPIKEAIRRNAPMMAAAPWEAIGVLFSALISGPERHSALSTMVNLGLIPHLRELVKDNQPFKSYLEGQVRGISDPRLYTRLYHLQFPIKLPVPLNLSQMEDFCTLVGGMSDEDAMVLYHRILKPEINTMHYITMYALDGRDRSKPVALARQALLENPYISVEDLQEYLSLRL